MFLGPGSGDIFHFDFDDRTFYLDLCIFLSHIGFFAPVIGSDYFFAAEIIIVYISFSPVSIYCSYCLFIYVQFSCCPLRALNWSIN